MLDPSTIKIGWRARVDLGDLSGLVQSIVNRGQLQPIVVRNGTPDGAYEIVCGLRRLTACKQLERQVAAIVVDAPDELQALEMQLLENVARKNFDDAELAEGLLRQKQLYDAIHPEATRGKTGKGKGKADVYEGEGEPAERFTKLASRKLNMAEGKVRELIQVAKLPEEIKAPIRDAPTTKKRNRAVMEVLRRVRQDNKRAKLEERAAEIEANRQENIPGVVPEKGKAKLIMKDCFCFFMESPGEQYDLILTDPPYESGRISLISHLKRTDIKTNFGAWDKLDVGWVVKAEPLLMQGGQFLIFSPLEAIGDYRFICESIGLTWRGALIWHKVNPGTVHRPVYLSSLEAICWATKGDQYYFPPWPNCGTADVHNFIEGPICQGRERLNHPTQKPEWIIDRLLDKHAHEKSHVLDPFAGVGTTLVCCKRRGILSTGTEIDPDFCGQALVRIRAV
jgi:site-specific DNA-methyltransferase (adenine-specific)